MQLGEARRAEFVGGQYRNILIKNIERERRSNSGQLAVAIASSQQLCPCQWKISTCHAGEKKCVF